LGSGVQNRGTQLNGLLDGASGTVQNAANVVDVLGQDRQQVARLVDNFGRVTQAIGQRGADIENLARGMRMSFTAVAARDQALGTALKQMPGTLRQVRSATQVLGTASGALAPMLTNLATAVRQLKPAVRLLHPAAVEGRGVLQQLSLTAAPLESTLVQVRSLSAPTARALPEVHKTLCQLVPALGYLAPYGRDVAMFFQNFLGSAWNYYDATGHALQIRLQEDPNAFMGTPPSVRDAEQKLLQFGLMSNAAVEGYDPYPPPGGAGNLTLGRGVAGPDQWPYPYTHVDPAC
jgi:phospholipid/cholesterol/gamma-HCH transport system substrate-binding protein